MTKLLYLENPDLYESAAMILHTDRDERGAYLILDQTPFYPQGGGQPADQGDIKNENQNFVIHDVRLVDGAARHYFEADSDEDLTKIISGPVTARVKEDRREVNKKYHSAAHLIAALVEKIIPAMAAVKGHQFPGEAFVEFNGVAPNEDDLMRALPAEIQEEQGKNALVTTEDLGAAEAAVIAERLPYPLPTDKALRVCIIDGFDPVPCGGTHVQNLAAIGKIAIQKCKSKKGKTKIFYEVI